FSLCSYTFFFQAEDGIRDFHVTGVQTCALPICNSTSNNKRFLRLWYEVENLKINYNKDRIIKEETLINRWFPYNKGGGYRKWYRSEEHTSELQSRDNLVCRLLLEKKKNTNIESS